MEHLRDIPMAESGPSPQPFGHKRRSRLRHRTSNPPHQTHPPPHTTRKYFERRKPPRESPRLAVHKRNRRITRLEHADDDVRGRLAGRDSVGGAASHGPSADNHRRGDKRDVTIHVHAQVAVPPQSTCTRTHAQENMSVWAQQPGNNPSGTRHDPSSQDRVATNHVHGYHIHTWLATCGTHVAAPSQ